MLGTALTFSPPYFWGTDISLCDRLIQAHFQFTAKGLLGSKHWMTHFQTYYIKWIPMSQMYSLVFVKNTDCLRMRGAINLMDLLDMRGSSEEHFSHTLFQRRLLAALFQGGQQLLMGLHNIANVTHQLSVFFFCHTAPAHANECIVKTLRISLHLKITSEKYTKVLNIYIPANLIYTDSIC